MKVEGAKQVHYESGPNMTPLVDVVMVILIFLMLAGSFGTSEHFLSTKALADATRCGPPVIEDPGLRLDIYVSSSPGGQFTARANGLGTIHTTDALAAALAAQRQRYADAGTRVDGVQVVIRPETNTPWGPVAMSHDAATRAGFTKVTFAWAE